MMRLMFAVTFLSLPLLAQFDYDRKQVFDTTCESLHPRPDAEVRGCGFTGPKGGRVNFIQVSPKGRKPPYPGVIFQHGGGQSMTNYLSEAFILARAGVVSVLVDAPARGEGKNSEINTMKLEAASRSAGRWIGCSSSRASTRSESPISAIVMEGSPEEFLRALSRA